MAAAVLLIALAPGPVDAFNQEVVRGEPVELSKEFGFYFYNGDDFMHPVVVVRDDVASLVLRGAHWTVPDGLSLQEQKIEIAPSTVTWAEGSRYGSTQGLILKIIAKVKVNDDAPVGDKQLFLTLPGLDAVASTVSAEPLSSPDSRFSSSILVESFTVYESRAAMWTPSRSAVFTVVGLIIVAILGNLIGRRIGHRGP